MMFVTATCIDNWVNMLKRAIIVNHHPLIKYLNEKYSELLEPILEPFQCKAGTVVFQQGTPADHLYLVIEGKVDVTYKPYDGVAITVYHVGKDGLFGWSAVVGSEKYTSSATAIETLEAVRLHGSDLRKLCVEHPDAGRDILESLAGAVSSRWQDAQNQVKFILEQGMKDKRE